MLPSENPKSNPRIAEFLLSKILGQDESEVVLGDFAEEHHNILESKNEWVAWFWYWNQTLQSVPFFVSLKFRNFLSRSQIMTKSPLILPSWKSSLAMLILLLPALFLAVPGVTQSLSGSPGLYDALRTGLNIGDINLLAWLIHPLAVLGGLGLALLLGAVSLLSITSENEHESFVTMIAVRKSAWNLVPFGLGIVLATVIFLYMIAENFGPF